MNESFLESVPYLTSMKSANGVLILVLGILGLIGFGCLTGLPAWIMGNSALKEIDSGMADPSERGLVVAGKILGIISTLLALIGLVIALLAVLGLVGFGLFAGSQSMR